MLQLKQPKKILVACEYSGRVREAFRSLGYDAISCDLLPTELPGPHHQGDVTELPRDHWDLVIAFPPCTHLAVSGARWFEQKKKDGRQKEAIDFFMLFANLQIPYCIENPVGIMSSQWRKPNQIIQPWQFGHGETKATCLWLQGLPLLQPTQLVEGREPRIHRLPPTEDRAKLRSLTYEGVAQAMAEQWGGECQ